MVQSVGSNFLWLYNGSLVPLVVLVKVPLVSNGFYVVIMVPLALMVPLVLLVLIGFIDSNGYIGSN